EVDAVEHHRGRRIAHQSIVRADVKAERRDRSTVQELEGGLCARRGGERERPGNSERGGGDIEFHPDPGSRWVSESRCFRSYRWNRIGAPDRLRSLHPAV